MLFNKTPQPEQDEPFEFWISYSDLMAGLLLVFILLLITTLLVSKEGLDKQQQLNDERERELEQQRKLNTAREQELKKLRKDIADVLGVRVELLKRLKERFSVAGGQISFDDATGAVRLGSNILFEEGSAKLSPEGRRTLDRTLPIYFDALLGDKRLSAYVDQIVFEGHTNSNYSSGKEDSAQAFLFNLELSQNRAYAAMEHVLKSDLGTYQDAHKLLAANGYSSSRLLYQDTPTGKEEDKAASRRLELRFRLKDEVALNRLKELLEQSDPTASNASQETR